MNQCDQQHESGKADDKDRIAELQTPSRMMTGGFDANDEKSDRRKGSQYAESVNEAEVADARVHALHRPTQNLQWR